MSVVNAGLMLSAPSGYTIDRSLRFRSSASAYLNWTPASAGNRKTWTWSGWVKRGRLTSFQVIYAAVITSGATEEMLVFDATDHLAYRDGASGDWAVTNAIFRDPSAWYHVVFVYDSANAVQADRGIFYVNGVRQTNSTNAIPQNRSSYINSTSGQAIGRFASLNSSHFDGYLTEVNFIDGQALDPTSFGEYNADTGVWQPIKYVGTYGTNGFYLNFSDNSTTTTLGYDYSGNSNNFTANNVSVTSGVTYDSMIDTPTPVADVRGNFCVLNPLNSPSVTLSNANLTVLTNTSGVNYSLGSFAIPRSGKWYWEYTGTSNGSECFCGVLSTVSVYLAYYGATGTRWLNGSGSAYGATYGNNDVIGVAVDVDAGTVTYYKNNVSQGAITYSVANADFFPYFADGSSSVGAFIQTNFGQRPFAYTPPSGFKALHTYNLPDSTVKDGSDYFNTVLYTGTGSTQSITGVGFQPDLVWIKNRSTTSNHNLSNVLSGAGYGLSSSTTGAEYTTNFDSFDNDGFTVSGTGAQINASGNSYVAWNWKANGSGVSNTDGSITSTVSANTTAGFSIVTANIGTSGNVTVGHGLGAAPNMVVIKNQGAAGNWHVWHSGCMSTPNEYLVLNATSGESTFTNAWGTAVPTSTVFGVQAGILASNTMVAYCFAEVEGFSKMGSYTGNGSTDGPFVFLGFRPRWLLVKKTNATSNWSILDTARDDFNVADNPLLPNLSNAESTSTSTSGAIADILSNGFKARGNSGDVNDSGATYIYMAFAESPFKVSLAR